MPEPAQDSVLPPGSAASQSPERKLMEDFAAIEAALASMSRGRWFLAEYLRRNRSAETDMLLDAIARLENAMLGPHRRAPSAGVLTELVEMNQAIARTRREIARIRPPHRLDKPLANAEEELDHIAEATRKATADILQAAEEIQEVAWTWRERGGGNAGLCDLLDQRATDIYTACSLQDIARQRTEKAVKALRFVEHRLNEMIALWGAGDTAGAASVDDEQRDALHDAVPERSEGLQQEHAERAVTADGGPRGQECGLNAPAEADPQPAQPFEPLDPLTVATLSAVKRAALFG